MFPTFLHEIIQFLNKETGKESNFLEQSVEHPPSLDMGDYSYSCFMLAKELKKNPAEISKELAKKFASTLLLEKAMAQGPYLNFFFFF